MTESTAQHFEWVPGPERGAWVAERLEGSIGGTQGADGLGEDPPALAWMIPSGYDALVRVLHPFIRDRPVGMTWAEFEAKQAEMAASGEWGELPGIESEPVSWAAAAAAFEDGAGPFTGETLGPGTLSYRLMGLAGHGEQLDEVATDGYRYSLPQEGRLEPATFAALARALARHTSTPDRGTVAVWDGWGGLTSANGVAFLGWSEPRSLPAPLERLRQGWFRRTLSFRAQRASFGSRTALRGLLGSRVRHPQGSGTLSKEAATGARLELPDRAYICFEAGVTEFAVEPSELGVPGWAKRAPWVRPDFAMHAETPSLVWPEAREWYLVSEIDFDSTLIACSRECADALLTAPGLEAVEIDRNTPLWP